MKKVLFIGSGKSYRSKFAEAFFNNRGKLECLFMLNTHGMGRYPSSRYPYSYSSLMGKKKPTKKLNKVSKEVCDDERNLTYGDDCYMHFHRNLTKEDFDHCDYVIAMNKSEHKKYLDKHFSEFADKIEYWDIPKKKVSDEVVELLKKKVNELYDDASRKGKK